MRGSAEKHAVWIDQEQLAIGLQVAVDCCWRPAVTRLSTTELAPGCTNCTVLTLPIEKRSS